MPSQKTSGLGFGHTKGMLGNGLSLLPSMDENGLKKYYILVVSNYFSKRPETFVLPKGSDCRTMHGVRNHGTLRLSERVTLWPGS